ncbi:MAG TPA: YeeE/YedE thiosulfate transporter family protein [Syntrophales bacterium]|nr:YeeE/YedE thiosulfate transporter family protein [Syntrophales bacterium]HPI56588.1 YeeE/YedE thiosulfate transporter family protein [Syntrophales bacterium]HPN24991.1 YeeE/YedE thiosulfate transporter family protein [Syntrophales bacterium]HQM29267.1 YeeE/YedE thiosulfate transporter family protein [Syntrophales bacterium]
MKMQIYGLVTGILFGFLLQKGRVLRYDKQVGALRLMDMTIVKFMLSAVLVGMVGVYLLKDMGLAKLSIKTTILGPVILGSLVFGLGWGLLGYCPGTQAGALGEGRWDALWGILGMILGAAVFAEFYPALKTTVYTWGNLGKITLPEVLGVSHWVVIPVFIVAGIVLFWWFEKKGL